jgi:hypothetical protein
MALTMSLMKHIEHRTHDLGHTNHQGVHGYKPSIIARFWLNKGGLLFNYHHNTRILMLFPLDTPFTYMWFSHLLILKAPLHRISMIDHTGAGASTFKCPDAGVLNNMTLGEVWG